MVSALPFAALLRRNKYGLMGMKKKSKTVIKKRNCKIYLTERHVLVANYKLGKENLKG